MKTLGKPLGSGLVLSVLLLAAPAAQDPPTPEERAVMALASDMTRAPNLDQWLKQNAANVTPQTAAIADRLGERALLSQQFSGAWALYSFAGMAYLRSGDRPTALKSMTNANQARFMAASTPELYRSIRSDVLDLIRAAEKIDASETAFRLAIIAADCTFFGGMPADRASPGGKWVISVLDDVAAALERAGAGRSRLDFERLVSLTHAALTPALGHILAEQEQITARMLKVAALVESSVPVDFAYQTAIGNEEKAIATAMALAELAYRSGRAANGSARLAFVAGRAKQAGNLDQYLSTIHLRYRGERGAKASPLLLRELRDSARSVATDIRRRYRSRAARIWNAYEFDTTYGQMLEDEAAQESTASLASFFEAVESMKARTLLDEIGQRPLPEASIALQSRIAELERTILGFAAPTPGEDLLVEELRLASQLSGFSTLSSNTDERAKALGSIEQLYRENALGFGAVTSPVSLKAVQDALEPREALLEYVIPYDALHPARGLAILLVTRTSTVKVHLDLDKILPAPSLGSFRMGIDGRAPVDSSPLGEQVVLLRTALRQADEKVTRTKLSGFYQLLIQPLVDRGFRPEQYARLIVVPHGVLHYVPFLALLDSTGAPLIRKTAVTTAPSASVWLELQGRRGPLDRWLAFANPTLTAADLPSLESSVNEVRRIETIMSGLQPRIELGATATRERFLATAPTASVLHLATHGEFPDDNALDRHGLLLAPGAKDDGVVRAMDIRRLDLSRVRLAVLSVCNGGLYRIGPADEPYGLVPAFLLGGAENVAATLWPIDDPFARRFTVEFYSHLLEAGPAEALRRAVLRFVDEDELVRRWAGFIVVGPGRPLGSAR